MSSPLVDLPPMPPLPAELVVASEAAHDRLAEELARVTTLARTVFVAVQRRRLIEALAAVDPVFPECEPPIVPPRRRFLSPVDRRRLEGVRVALDHVDSRLTMVRMGSLAHVVAPETPMVLNAMVEVPDVGEPVTNAGSLRAGGSRFDPTESDYLPPPPDRCRELLLGAVDLATTAPAPAITRAGWLVAVMFAVHPFVDGNGRTARMLFQAVHSEGVPGGFDWTTATEWSARRRAYVAAAKASQAPSLPSYDPVRLAPIHLMTYIAECSVTSARRGLHRLRAIAGLVDGLVGSGSREEVALAEAFVTTERNVHLDELGELGLDQPTAAAAVEALVAAHRLEWTSRGRLRLVGANPFARPAVVVAGARGSSR